MISGASNPIDSHIGHRMQLARALAGQNLNDVAAALSITPSQLRAYESGERIGASLLFVFAQHLNQPISYFFDGLLED